MKTNASTRGLRRIITATAAAGAATLLAISPASATGMTSVYTGQSEAGRVNYWSGTDSFRVSDTKCDGHSVYAQYQRAGASTRTLSDTRGCRTHRDYDLSFTNGQTIKYRVCVSRPALPDTCGQWKWDTTG